MAAVGGLVSLSLILKRGGSWLDNWVKNLDEEAKDSAQTLGQIRSVAAGDA